jgi:hypothetical protein
MMTIFPQLTMEKFPGLPYAHMTGEERTLSQKERDGLIFVLYSIDDGHN